MPEPTREEVDALSGPVVLEFGTSWCHHCQAIQPFMSGMRSKYPQLRHLKIEDGPGRRLGRTFHVKLWPTLIFLKDGHIVGEIVRPPSEEVVNDFAQLTVESDHDASVSVSQ